jgi:hypothetical protein
MLNWVASKPREEIRTLLCRMGEVPLQYKTGEVHDDGGGGVSLSSVWDTAQTADMASIIA